MLIWDKWRDHDQTTSCPLAPATGPAQTHQQDEHEDVQLSSDQERPADTERAWDRVQISPLVKFVILTSIEHIKSTHPERNRASEQKNSGIKRATYSNPRCRRRHAERKSQYQM